MVPWGSATDPPSPGPATHSHPIPHRGSGCRSRGGKAPPAAPPPPALPHMGPSLLPPPLLLLLLPRPAPPSEALVPLSFLFSSLSLLLYLSNTPLSLTSPTPPQPYHLPSSSLPHLFHHSTYTTSLSPLSHHTTSLTSPLPSHHLPLISPTSSLPHHLFLPLHHTTSLHSPLPGPHLALHSEPHPLPLLSHTFLLPQLVGVHQFVPQHPLLAGQTLLSTVLLQLK
ncbi:hypothetical protein E2C01_037001 [Portunus trituberculatus]|uniref:Uncharacterized protein n=1 Tax=Portunus trituberculatus TaxID=210409 RepID=A0A5B7FDG3_PORTR|nr:hypothetical protein [Portunus trituberculatus]